MGPRLERRWGRVQRARRGGARNVPGLPLDVAALGVPSLRVPLPERRLLGLLGEGALARAISTGQAGFPRCRLSGLITQPRQEIQWPHRKEAQLLAEALSCAQGTESVRCRQLLLGPAVKDMEKLSGAQPQGRGAQKAAPGDAQGSPHQGCLEASWLSLHSLLASLGHLDPTLGLDTEPCHLPPAPMSASSPGVAALDLCDLTQIT